MDEERIQLTAEESGERIDALLARAFPALSRSLIQKCMEAGAVTLNGKPVKKNARGAAGDEVLFAFPETEPLPLQAQALPLDVVYEDGDLIVVNKARGMVVHPAPGHPDGTLVNALLWHCGDTLSGIGGVQRPGIVHRIDKDTSGLLVAAKNDFAHQGLSAQLSDHSLFREYEAVACGSFRETGGTVDKPIGRHPVDRKRMAVTEKNGKRAVTHWELKAAYRGYALILCRLETGRTHQIRVHMASVGHPLLGDGLYGAKCPDKGLEGQCLHARRLTLIHPRTGETMCFEAPRPAYFTGVLEKLGPTLQAEKKGD
ncbi:MAG: RluA family pseudouridine synthase [Oscillospiraceae bacterium]|nr:RluA family pseudouridine synthase [Oscillospiraceae bacterium]